MYIIRINVRYYTKLKVRIIIITSRQLKLPQTVIDPFSLYIK